MIDTKKLKQISDALYVERDPKGRVFFTHAHAIQYARRHNKHHDQQPGLVLSSPGDRSLAKWLLYHATPDDFRDLADAFENATYNLNRRGVEIWEAYSEAKRNKNPFLRDFPTRVKYLPASSAITWGSPKRLIEPTFEEFTEEFRTRFPNSPLPREWNVIRTIERIDGCEIQRKIPGRKGRRRTKQRTKKKVTTPRTFLSH